MNGDDIKTADTNDLSVFHSKSMIQIANIIHIHRTDYWRRGHTAEKLGFEHMSVSELTYFVKEGVID